MDKILQAVSEPVGNFSDFSEAYEVRDLYGARSVMSFTHRGPGSIELSLPICSLLLPTGPAELLEAACGYPPGLCDIPH